MLYGANFIFCVGELTQYNYSYHYGTHQPPPLSLYPYSFVLCVESTHANENFLNRVAWNSVIKVRRKFSSVRSGHLLSFIPHGL